MSEPDLAALVASYLNEASSLYAYRRMLLRELDHEPNPSPWHHLTFEQKASRRDWAVSLLNESPLLRLVEEAGLHEMFSSAGGGGGLEIVDVGLDELVAWADESTRSTASFTRLIGEAASNIAAFRALEALSSMDGQRPGRKNHDLQKWAQQANKKPSARRGKRFHLVFRDALIGSLLADAWVLGFPQKNDPDSISEPENTIVDVTLRVLRKRGVNLGHKSLLRIWHECGKSSGWHLPELEVS